MGGVLVDNTYMGGALNATRMLQADDAMRSFAENSGGATFTPRFVEDIPIMIRVLASQLRYTCRIGFVAPKHKPDGKFHKLQVDVDVYEKADKPQAHYRKGY